MDKESQTITSIASEELTGSVENFKNSGYRLVQMCCTYKDGLEITYTFEKDNVLNNLRLNITPDTEVESIGGIYSYAFLYENEMKDLFGVKIAHMAVDFKGRLYQTAVDTPFAPAKENAKPEEAAK